RVRSTSVLQRVGASHHLPAFPTRRSSDLNLHSCGTVRPHGHRELGHPEPGLYTVGVKSYGRAPTFLMATGFEESGRAAVALDAKDRKSTRLNSSHSQISYAVFCLKKKTKK